MLCTYITKKMFTYLIGMKPTNERPNMECKKREEKMIKMTCIIVIFVTSKRKVISG